MIHERFIEIFNYLPQDISQEFVDICEAVCNDERIFSDETGVNNRDKWAHVRDIFDCPDSTLWDVFCYESVLESDDVVQCEAMHFLTDLRDQSLKRFSSRHSDNLQVHLLAIKNLTWSGKFRMRVGASHFANAQKGARLT